MRALRLQRSWHRRRTGGRERSSSRGVLAIVSGSVGGQLVVLLFSPLLTRQYGPSGLGYFTVFLSLATIFSVVASMRLELAIPLPDSDRDGFHLVGMCLLWCCLAALVGTVVSVMAGMGLSSTGQDALAAFVLLVPMTGSLIALFQTLNQLAIRQRQFGRIGQRNLLQASVTSGTQVMFGAVGVQPIGLGLGFCVGQAAGCMSLLRGSGFRWPRLRSAEVRRGMMAVLRRYRRFPLVSAPSGLINVAGVMLPPVLVGALYGITDAGQFGVAQRTLAVPVFVIGTAIGQVYLGTLARAKRKAEDTLAVLFDRSTWRLVVVSVCCAVPIALFGPWIYSTIFGPEWLMGGEFARALSICLCFQMVASPLSQTLTVFERQIPMLLWDLSRLALTTASLVVAHLLGRSAIEAVWFFSIVSAVLYSVLWWLCRKTVRASVLIGGVA